MAKNILVIDDEELVTRSLQKLLGKEGYNVTVVKSGAEAVKKVKETDFDLIISDGDDSEENKAKYRWAKKHFADLNNELQKTKIKQQYFFHFLSPSSYAEFSEYLLDGRLFKHKFRSDLEDILER